MSDSEILMIPKFDGDYEHWAMLMENLLRSKEWWDLIEPGVIQTEPRVILTGAQRTERAKMIVKDHKVKNYLFASLDKTLLKTILNKNTSKELWDSMKMKFQGNHRVQSAQRQRLRRTFEVLEMRNEEAITDYFSRVMEVVNDMRNLGENMDDSKVVEKILRTLTERFTYVVCAIEESNNITELTVDGLQSSLMVHEQNLSRHEGEGKSLKVESQWRSCGGRSRREDFNQERRRFGARGGFQGKGREDMSLNLEMIECFKCHKKGHFKAECPDWKKEANYMEMEEDMLLLTHVNKMEKGKEHIWLLDSGCSNHMCGTKEWFIELDENFKQIVKLSDDRRMIVERKGKLRLEINGRNMVMSDVYYVPHLKENLFSVGQLQLKGLRIIIEEDVCKVWHKQKRIMLMQSTMSRNRVFIIHATIREKEGMEEVNCLQVMGESDCMLDKRFDHKEEKLESKETNFINLEERVKERKDLEVMKVVKEKEKSLKARENKVKKALTGKCEKLESYEKEVENKVKDLEEETGFLEVREPEEKMKKRRQEEEMKEKADKEQREIKKLQKKVLVKNVIGTAGVVATILFVCHLLILGGGTVTRISKRQPVVTLLTAEVELMIATYKAYQVVWFEKQSESIAISRSIDISTRAVVKRFSFTGPGEGNGGFWNQGSISTSCLLSSLLNSKSVLDYSLSFLAILKPFCYYPSQSLSLNWISSRSPLSPLIQIRSGLRELREQIKSVKSTQKITEAMRLVAAARVRIAQDAVLKCILSTETLAEVLHSIKRCAELEDIDFPPSIVRPVKRVAMVVVSGDKGLSGARKNSVVKKANLRIQELKERGIYCVVISVCKKGNVFLSWRDEVLVDKFIEGGGVFPTTKEAQVIADDMFSLFVNKEMDKVELVHKVVSLVKYDPVVHTLLPLSMKEESCDVKGECVDAKDDKCLG